MSIVEAIMRSSRKKVAHQYNDSESDSEFLMPEVEGEQQSSVIVGVSMIVERVLGRKMMKNPDAEAEVDELFFIKWKKVRLEISNDPPRVHMLFCPGV